MRVRGCYRDEGNIYITSCERKLTAALQQRCTKSILVFIPNNVNIEEKRLEIIRILKHYTNISTGAWGTEAQTETQSVCKVCLCAEVKAPKIKTHHVVNLIHAEICIVKLPRWNSYLWHPFLGASV